MRWPGPVSSESQLKPQGNRRSKEMLCPACMTETERQNNLCRATGPRSPLGNRRMVAHRPRPDPREGRPSSLCGPAAGGSLMHRLLPRGALPWGEGQRRIGAADGAPSPKAQEHVELWPPAIPAPSDACSTTTERRLPPRPGSRRRLPAPGAMAMAGPRGARHHPAARSARDSRTAELVPRLHPPCPGSSAEGGEPEALGRVPLQDRRREERRKAMRTDLAIGRARGAPVVPASGRGCGDIGAGRRGAPRHPVLLSGGPH